MSSASDSHRLAILTAEEIEDLYALPRFSDDDRQLYFELSPAELSAVEARTTSVGVALALELGYFKAKRQFFSFEQAVVDDNYLGRGGQTRRSGLGSWRWRLRERCADPAKSSNVPSSGKIGFELGALLVN